MFLLKNRISQSLKKIISQSQPESPQKNPSNIKLAASIRLESIKMRKLEPIQFEKKSRYGTPKNPKKAQLRRILTKFDLSRKPKNASRSRYDPQMPNYRSFIEERKGHEDGSEHLSYNELVLKREKLEDSRRLIILKQVIKENVKKKNQEMKLRSKKRLKTIM